MPIDYKKYPPNWKTEIRPAILARAENRCECCGVKNHSFIFRGLINKNQPTEREVYQNNEGDIFDANNSDYLFTNLYAEIYPLSRKPDQQATKVVLTIAHLDHDTGNNDFENLKALCQRCHLRHDRQHHADSRKYGREWKRDQLKMELNS